MRFKNIDISSYKIAFYMHLFIALLGLPVVVAQTNGGEYHSFFCTEYVPKK